MANPAHTAQPAVSIEEIRSLVEKDLPLLPPAGGEAGGFEGARLWLARARHAAKPAVRHPRICLFTASGVPDLGPVSGLSGEVNADLKVFEVGQGAPKDMTAAAHAMAYGMMAVQPGVDLVAVAALSRGAEVVGDPMETLLKTGADISALLGCIIAARLGRIPVLAEGPGAKTAMDILEAIRPGTSDHCRDPADLFASESDAPAGMKSALAIALLKTLAGAG